MWRCSIKKETYERRFLSFYIFRNKIGNLYSYSHRHNQNLSLWKKNGIDVELLHYWELERVTGFKQHQVAFYNAQQAVEIKNKLLAQYGINIRDMVEVWGPPGLSTCEDYHSINDLPKYCYHSIAHLFSGILIDTQIFYHNDILAFAVDGAPDKLLEDTSNNYDECSYYEFFSVKSGQREKVGDLVDRYIRRWADVIERHMVEQTSKDIANKPECNRYKNLG